MAKRISPTIDSAEPKYKKRAKVSKTPANLTRTEIDVAPDDPTSPTQEGNLQLFIDQGLKRFQMAVDAETYNRVEGLQDAMMVDGDGQWEDNIKGARMRKKKPCLTLNRFKPMISHVANEFRMARAAMKVEAVGGGADPEDAEIRQGILRHIEVMSSAETVYDTAFERMIEKGWSWFRVVTDWESPTSRHQVIKIEGFTNDFCIYSDPNAEDPTRKDMKWAFIVYDMPRGQYMEDYKGSKACSLTSYASVGDSAPNWITSDSVRVVEYYYMKDEKAFLVYVMGNSDGVWKEDIEERDGLWYKSAELARMDAGVMQPEAVLPVPIEVDDDGKPVGRWSTRPKPKWCKMNAVEILDGDKGDDFDENTEGREIAGKYIPLIMVSGQERFLNGQRRLSGMVRSNRDAQRIYNYMASGFVEAVALAPKSPYIAAAGQVEDFKAIWDTLNTENWSYLPYKPIDLHGQPVPPPQRQSIEPPVAAYIEGLREFDNILKAGFNIFDPSLGTAKSDQSGRAIAGLQARSDSANMNWMDNMRRSIMFCGEVILEMIPVIYDAARIITIDRSGQKQQLLINQEFADPKTGVVKNHDMAVGKFSCTISLGQYASKREQAVESLTGIAKNVPQVALALLPMILGQMDTPLAEEAAALIKRMQPPALQDPGSPEQMQTQLTALAGQNKQLVAALQHATEAVRTKVMDLASKEFIAALNNQATLASAAIKAGDAQGLQQAQQEYDRLSQLIDQNHERVLQELQQSHEAGLAAMQAASAQQPQGAAS